MKHTHTELKRGAAVRLHGYCPARVTRVYNDCDGFLVADCVITGARNIPRPHTLGPHGYRNGQSVTVAAREAVPRDCVYTVRGTFGRIAWHCFPVHRCDP